MSSVIWHDLECGGYVADLPLWRRLAQRAAGPVLDVGAGTGRTTLDLARAGHAVTALDLDPALLTALRSRAGGLRITTVAGDARAFDLNAEFALCIVPMQTIQLLGGAGGRRRFLECAARHLAPGAALAIALTDELELFEAADAAIGPLPDVREVDGVVYSSRPVAVRTDGGAGDGGGYVLVRVREIVTAAGRLTAETDLVRLDRLDPPTLEDEARAAGLRPLDRLAIEPTDDHVGSTVVVLGA